MKRIEDKIKEEILVLDGAFGTMIQKLGFKEQDFRGKEFMKHPVPVFGFNDLLNLTKPSSIFEIHKLYLSSGADIITTNTFNSNRISMKDYGLNEMNDLVHRLNKEGALIARKAINEFKKEFGKEDIYIGGSIGPTNRSASLSPDISDPLLRNVSYDELFDAYKEQVVGLLEGGVDLLLCETFFDTLNLKAALAAINFVLEERKQKIPVVVSATVSDNAGRILSGQTLKAFVTSVNHFENILAIGLNCGFGPDKMRNLLMEVNEINCHYTSCHPNAGLPDINGCYNVSIQDFIESYRPILEEGLVNIVGGCCGTTPEYISELSKLVKKINKKKILKSCSGLRLSGLDMLECKDKFLIVGERCNVAGSAKFLRLIREGAFEEAAQIAKNQILHGAQIIDINTDDPLIDAKKEMVDFIRYLLADPDIAKVPFMIDSSNWEVIGEALKNIQGKGIVNSLSLKEGEEIFIKRAKRIKELGFALIVMAFDENGQADTYQRKIEICERAFNLLTQKCGYRSEDIIFDVNIMTIGTGMPEHERYAIDFLNAIAWIKENLPGTKTSGGLSNLSFAFRGKNQLREYMHVIFLHHAQEYGLDMAIVNPSQLIAYNDIPENIKNAIEDLIFNRCDSIETLIEWANTSVKQSKEKRNEVSKIEINPETIESKLKNDLKKGELILLESHLTEALEIFKDPMRIIEGPLLEGMKEVGILFGEGKMFLPQVVKTARTMKKAVDILSPELEKRKNGTHPKKNGKILIATVKGDVHDIGKNIVSTILSCNNYEIIDLGIMVPGEEIVRVALKEKPDIICLSGLITPSLAEMATTVKLLSAAGIQIPIMIGGAATSQEYTALKIDPLYKGIVLHMSDASQNPIAAANILNAETHDSYIEEIKNKYLNISSRERGDKQLVSFKEVLEIVAKEKRNDFKGIRPKLNKSELISIDLNLILPLINWKMFFNAWKLQGKYIDGFPFDLSEHAIQTWLNSLSESEIDKAKEALKLYKKTNEIISYAIDKKIFDGKAFIRFDVAEGNLDGITIAGKFFPMLRQQSSNSSFLSCADYIGDAGNNYIGFFAVTAGLGLNNLALQFAKEEDQFSSLIIQTISDRIVEATAEWLQKYVYKNYWKVDLRPAWGYPMLPDQSLLLETQDFIPYDKLNITLTENGAMFPSSSISGLFISKPESKYFMVGEIGEDQIEEYALKRDLTTKRIKEILRL